ncbi:TPA: hypothetical protein ACH3X1_002912 [Trebouxia sp. C0004]
MRGKPEKSFKRITEALTEKFPQPLGMLDDMLTQIEELMETSKTSSKCKSSSSGTTEPKAKKPKQQRVAQNEAAAAMHAELRAMGFTSPADFGKVKWEDFKTDSPYGNIQVIMHHGMALSTAIVNVTYLSFDCFYHGTCSRNPPSNRVDNG